MDRVGEVLAFWFDGWDDDQPLSDDDPRIALWWSATPEIDARIRRSLGADHERAAAGALNDWASSARGALALVLLLDQVPRNIHRGTAGAHATDAAALRVTETALDAGLDRELAPIQRVFLSMPLMHAEDLGAQQRSVAVFEALALDTAGLARAGYYAGTAQYARKHLEVVERFGRFPSRNESLGRPSTPEELDFLAKEGRGF